MFISLVDTQKMPSLANSVLKAYSPSNELIRIPFYQDNDAALGYELYVDSEGLISDSNGQNVSSSVGVLIEAMVRVVDKDTGVTKRTFFVRPSIGVMEGSGDVFVIMYSSGSGGDKTFAEIQMAHDAGKLCVLKDYEDGVFRDSTISMIVDGTLIKFVYNNSTSMIEYVVNPDDEWSETSKILVEDSVWDDKVYGRKNRNWVEITGDTLLVTYDGTDGDKTQLEIYAAMSAGKVCLLYDSDWKQFAYGGLVGSGNTIYFYNTRPGSEGLACTEYSVTSSNVWTRRQNSYPGEAPIDNKTYVRWNGTWKEVTLNT